MTTTITTSSRLTILKHLANGKSLETVAAITKLDRYEVLDVASHHGYPDLEKIAKAALLVADKIERDAIADRTPPRRTSAPAPTEQPRPRPVPASAAVASTKPASPAPTTAASVLAGERTGTPTPLTRPDEIRVAINAGKQSDSKRVQALTNRILEQVDKLKTLLGEEQAKHEAARRAAAEKAALQEKRARLEKELAEVNAALRGKTSTKHPKTTTSTVMDSAPASAPQLGETPAKVVRAWAHATGIDCPATGKLPRSVREAYATAHPVAETAHQAA